MKGYAAIAVAVILIAASLPYVYQITRRHVVPTLSTWIILAVATSLSGSWLRCPSPCPPGHL
jgi:hypothetical protein